MIRKYKQEDSESLWQSFAETFGNDAARSLKERWQWQYLANPYNIDGPQVYVLVNDGKVVGMHGAFAVPMVIRGDSYQGYILSDFFTLPDYRLGGIALVKRMQKLPGIGIGQPNPMSQALWSSLGCFHYYKSRKRTAFLRGSISSPKAFLRYGLKPVSLLNKYFIHHNVLSDQKQLYNVDTRWTIVNSIVGLESEIDSFWIDCEQRCDVTLKKDAQYLKWRYIDFPNRSYQIRVAIDDQGVLALIVFEVRHYQGRILETLYREEARETLKVIVQVSLREMMNSGATECYVLCNDKSRNSLSGAFWRSLGFWVKGRSRSVVGYHTLPSKVAGVLSDGGSWSYSLGDGERDLVS